MEIGKRLSVARAQAKRTQKQVAESLHVTRSTISNWENGRSFPDIASLVQLTDLYHISLDAIMKEDERLMHDLQVKEQQRRDGVHLLWATIMIAVFIAAILLANLFSVSGFEMSRRIWWVLFFVFGMNIIAIAVATRTMKKARTGTNLSK